MGLTFASIGVAHVVGGTVRVIMWVGSGSIYSNELAPVHLQNIEKEKERWWLYNWPTGQKKEDMFI